MGGKIDVLYGYWSRRLSGAKLEREETAWEAVLAEILSVASPDNRLRVDE
jgi:hypothetical protein